MVPKAGALPSTQGQAHYACCGDNRPTSRNPQAYPRHSSPATADRNGSPTPAQPPSAPTAALLGARGGTTADSPGGSPKDASSCPKPANHGRSCLRSSHGHTHPPSTSLRPQLHPLPYHPMSSSGLQLRSPADPRSLPLWSCTFHDYNSPALSHTADQGVPR